VNNLLSRFPFIQTRAGKLLVRNWLFAIAAVGFGLVVARLIVIGRWEIAAALVFVFPIIFILQRYPFLAILVWLILMPFLTPVDNSAARQVYWIVHRFLPPITLLIILLPSALGLTQKPLPRLGFPEWMMGGYVLASLISIWLNNPDPLATTYLFYDRTVVPIILYLIVRLSAPDESVIRWMVPAAFFIAISQSFIGTLSWFAPRLLPNVWVDYENRRTIGTLVNTNAYITTLVLVGFLVLHFGLNSSSKRIRLASTITFLLCAYGIFISFSRAGWLAGILAALGLVAIHPRYMMRLGLAILPLFILAAGLFMQDQLNWANQRLDSADSAVSRVPVYAAGFRMFAAKPVTGWGYGNFDLYDFHFQMPPIFNMIGDDKDHASHNVFITILAEQGVIGLIFFLAPVIYWLGVAVKRFSKLPKRGFWSRGLVVIFWMTILSHIVVYNFANMRIVFTLGMWWLSLGLIARFMDAHQPASVEEQAPVNSLYQRATRPIGVKAGSKS
jgi:O-antigen ligase